jgi:hypothetical protein
MQRHLRECKPSRLAFVEPPKVGVALRRSCNKNHMLANATPFRQSWPGDARTCYAISRRSTAAGPQARLTG